MSSKVECPDCNWEFYSPYSDIRDGMLKVHRNYHHDPTKVQVNPWANA